jgi:hypothetical protein
MRKFKLAGGPSPSARAVGFLPATGPSVPSWRTGRQSPRGTRAVTTHWRTGTQPEASRGPGHTGRQSPSGTRAVSPRVAHGPSVPVAHRPSVPVGHTGRLARRPSVPGWLRARALNLIPTVSSDRVYPSRRPKLVRVGRIPTPVLASSVQGVSMRKTVSGFISESGSPSHRRAFFQDLPSLCPDTSQRSRMAIAERATGSESARPGTTYADIFPRRAFLAQCNAPQLGSILKR